MSGSRRESLVGVEIGRDVSISMDRANLLGLPLIPILAAVTILPFWALWGSAAVGRGFSSIWSLWVIPGLIGVIIVHEALHGIGFLIGGVRGEHIHFGIDKETLTPYAGCRVSVTAAIYRWAVLLPAIAMGVLPWIAALVTGSGWLAIFSAAMLIFAAGDLIVVWTIRSVPGSSLVLDHPHRVGCMVLDG